MRFEQIAGRSAMLGTITALFIEGVTQEGLFFASDLPEVLPAAACAAALAVSLAGQSSCSAAHFGACRVGMHGAELF